MAFGDEVRFKIGGDTSSLSRSFSKAEGIAEASGRKMERSVQRAFARMRAPGEQGQDTRRRLADDAALERRQVAQVNLNQFKKKQTYEEANTVGKIKIVTGELADLAKRRAKEEEGSVSALRIELAIEERLAKLRGLRAQQQVAQTAGGPTLAQQTAKPKEETPAPFLSPQNLFRAFGTAITFGLERIINWNQSRTRVAQAQEASTATGVESLRDRFAAIGGAQGQLRQGQARERDLEREKQFYENRKKFLSTGVQGVVSKLAPEELTKAEEAIQRINGELQKQHDTNALTERELAKQTSTYGNQTWALRQIQNLKLAGVASEKQLAAIEVERAKAQLRTALKYGTPEEARAAHVEVRQAEVALDSSRLAALQRSYDVAQDLSGQAAQGRTFANGQPRGRSETERIAQRAEAYRRRAASLVVTNGRGQFAANTTDTAGFFIGRAQRDESAVASRLAQGSKGVPQDFTTDATGIKSELAKANQILTAISASLSEQDIGATTK